MVIYRSGFGLDVLRFARSEDVSPQMNSPERRLLIDHS